MKKSEIDYFFKKNYGRLLRCARKLKKTLWADKRVWLKELDEEDIISYYYVYCCRSIWCIKEVKDIELNIYGNDFIQYLKFKFPLREQEINSIAFHKIDEELDKYRGK